MDSFCQLENHDFQFNFQERQKHALVMEDKMNQV